MPTPHLLLNYSSATDPSPESAVTLSRAMSRKHSDQVAVTFHDVAASFSEEEWKLLNEWQKELYKTVMNEIHQALISLGPLIATSVFSLRAKEKEDVCPVENQDSERRHVGNRSPSGMIANSDMSFRINGKENQHLKDPPSTESRESSDYLSTGYDIVNPDTLVRNNKRNEAYIWDDQQPERRTYINESTSHRYPAVHPDILLRIHQEEDLNCRDLSGSEGSEIHNRPTKGFPLVSADVCWRKKGEPDVIVIDEPGLAGGGGYNSGPSAGHEVISFIIKEDEPYSLDRFHVENRESINCPTADPVISSVFSLSNEPEHEINFQREPRPEGKTKGVRIINRKMNSENSMNCPEIITPCNATSKKGKTPIFQKPEKAQHSREQSERNEECRVKINTHCESVFSNPSNSNPHQGTFKIEYPDEYNACESNLANATVLTCEPNAPQNWSPYTFTEHKQSFFQKGDSAKHHRTHTEHSSYQCSECLKNFSGKSYLIRHQRTHLRHRPYRCIECNQSFSWKTNLIRHQTKHTGEKPYQCDECEKSFTQKGTLTIHQRIHSGERPYQCTECETSFREKKQLIRHFRKVHKP